MAQQRQCFYGLRSPRLWLVLLGLGGSQLATGQTIVRYRSATGQPLYTAAQLDSLLQSRNAKLTEKGLLMERKLGPFEQHHDTLLYAYTLRVSNAAVRTNELRYQALVGKALPAFTLRDLAGRRLASASLLGRPVVLNLWFTTCPPCLAEIPALNRFKQQHPEVTFLALTYEPRSKVQAYLQTLAFDWQHLPNAATYCAQFTHDYPISVFVDRRGIIQQIIGGMPQPYDRQTHRLSGEVDATSFAQALKSIL